MIEVHMTVGCPGSGKSTFAEKLVEEEGFLRHSFDQVRVSHWGSKRRYWKQVQGTEGQWTKMVMHNVYYFTLVHLLQQRPMKLVIDNTHIQYGHVDDAVLKTLNILNAFKVEPHIHVFMCPFEELILRNNERVFDDQVPEDYLLEASRNHHLSDAWWRDFDNREEHYSGHR